MSSRVEIIRGDCLDVLRDLAEASVDSVVTDPPYGLGFMGKAWDDLPPGREVFEQCLRVLKPGGHLLAFGGSRTYHRLAVAVEDAGFEIRDQIMWLYGSGFPKSLDVSKAIDKAAGAEREVVGRNPNFRDPDRNADHHARWNNAVVTGDVTAPATDAARQWNGWGTALKPAHEPIVVARKPLEGTVAQNVLRHGTGAINIDGCRVEFTGDTDKASAKPGGKTTAASGNLAGKAQGGAERAEFVAVQGAGRFPANLIHDGSAEVLAGFPETKSGKMLPTHTIASRAVYGQNAAGGYVGSAARFFYCAKASKRDREDGNIHPTVKPTDLMRYLCRLVTPPGGTVLDPFMGSGSTGKAAQLEGFNFIGIERETQYIEVAQRRLGLKVSAAVYETDVEALL